MSDFSLPPDPGAGAAEAEAEGPSASVQAAYAAALVSLSLAASAANGLVLLVFYRRPVLRSPSNRFVLSLVLANLLGALVVAPTLLAQLLRPSAPPPLRQAGAGLTTLCVAASVFSIVAIAVDRYSAVLSPLHYAMTITRRRSRGMIAGVWLCAALLAAPPLAGVVPVRGPRHPCAASSLRLAYALTLVGAGFTLPLCALCWIYARMYSAAHRNSERTRRHSVSTNPGEVVGGGGSRGGSLDLPQPPPPAPAPPAAPVDAPRRKIPPLGQLHASAGAKRRCSNASLSTLFFREEGRAVKTAAMVVASFLLCWTLFFATALADAWASSGAGAVPELCRRLAELLALSSGCVTPAIYVFRNETARAEALRLLLWWRPLAVAVARGADVCGKTQGAATGTTHQESFGSGGCGGRRHSLSVCDSVSVQSFQIPALECRHCASEGGPAADFVATYEVVESPCEDKESSQQPTPGAAKTPRTRRESVTFRLAFLPSARRCQACVRQNSDSSSGSGHPLLRDAPDGPADAPRRQAQATAPQHGGGAETNNNQGDGEGEEETPPPHARGLPRSAGTNFQDTSLERPGDWRQDSAGSGGTVRQDSARSDVTVDSGVVADMYAADALLRRPHRHKLQRLAAVEDEDSATPPPSPSPSPSPSASPSLGVKSRLKSSFKSRFQRPAFRIPRCDF